MAIPTSLVGSYAQPDWLIDRERLRERFPACARAGAVAHDDGAHRAVWKQLFSQTTIPATVRAPVLDALLGAAREGKMAFRISNLQNGKAH